MDGKGAKCDKRVAVGIRCRFAFGHIGKCRGWDRAAYYWRRGRWMGARLR